MGKRKILFVDDIYNHVKDYIDYLKLEGFDCDYSKFEDFPNILSSKKFDIISLDIMNNESLDNRPPEDKIREGIKYFDFCKNEYFFILTVLKEEDLIYLLKGDDFIWPLTNPLYLGFFNKNDYLPSNLAKEIQVLIDKNINENKKL
jgi:hypothetical protein